MKITNVVDIINEICSCLGDGWFINEKPDVELITGYYQLISTVDKNKDFSMYCCVNNGRLHIRGFVFNDVSGDNFTPALNKGALKLAEYIRKNVISQKNYLFSIFNNRK
ncbi:hypothetical protein QB94_20615 [Salmonella enterica subsp. enterica serovar Newport]|nr:hypothetical protein [Salmonella enterica subsp. enterica serovar Newport]